MSALTDIDFAAVRDFLVVLRPAWWVLRGYLAAMVLAWMLDDSGQPTGKRKSTDQLNVTYTMPRKIRRLVDVLKIVGLGIRSRWSSDCP